MSRRIVGPCDGIFEAEAFEVGAAVVTNDGATEETVLVMKSLV